MQQNRPFNILVVDDEPPICDLLTRVASNVFPEATFINTRSAQETIDFLNLGAGKWPQLVLLDIDLHLGVNGLELLPQLQTIFQGRAPIVLLTTSTKELDRREAISKGAVAFTQKPDSLQEWRAYVLALRSNWYELT